MLYTAAVVLIVVYSLFRWAAGRDVLLGLGIVAVEFTISTVTDFSGAGDALGGAAVLLFTAALGAAIRFRTMAREHLMEQAKLLEREQLARELHDTVAHHVSAIAVQAQAGLVLARSSSPAGAAGALEIIDGGAAQTLAEMRAMVATLRDRHSQASPDPRCHLNDIELLGVVRTGSALSVDVSLHGDLTGLPQALEAALYRVAQETVTNSRRHARLATRVEVAVIGKDSEVELTVKDDGESATRSRSGYGLIGMTERVTLLGGTLTAGPAPDHGWCVRAVFPRPRIRK
jgi:signal transduction histidine kinase